MLHPRVEAFGDGRARAAGLLRPITKRLGPSLGDRARLALARQRRATALTTDAAWIELPWDFGIEARVVRSGESASGNDPGGNDRNGRNIARRTRADLVYSPLTWSGLLISATLRLQPDGRSSRLRP